jgi:hypothetical protein
MMYGLITAATVTVTMLCVTIHRRHLMVNTKDYLDCFICIKVCIYDAMLICLLHNILTGMGFVCS